MELDIEKIQHKLYYKFNNVGLLKQAFITKGYSVESGGENNEILEFIGDRAFEIAVTRILIENYSTITNKQSSNKQVEAFKSKCDEGRYTELKIKIVKGKSQSKFMDELGWYDMLKIGKTEKNNSNFSKEKKKEDLFEAILGAVALDCNWNIDTITQVSKIMIDFDSFLKNEKASKTNYITYLKEYCKKLDCTPITYEPTEKGNVFECKCYINHFSFVGFAKGKNKVDAENSSALDLLEKIKEKGLQLKNITSTIGMISADNVVTKMKNLISKKLIEEPQLTENVIKKAGLNTWRVEMYSPLLDITYVSDKAKKNAARKDCYMQLFADIIKLNANIPVI